MNDLEQLKKALDMAGAGGTLQQPIVDQVLQELIEVNNPLRMNLPRKPGSGSAWVLNQRTSRGAGSSFVNDTEEPGETQGTYVPKSFPYATILERRKVTRKLQAVGKSLLDVEAEEVENALQNVRDTEENALVNGDAATNPKQFNGLRKLIPSGQVAVAGANGAPLSLDLLDQAIDLNRGNPNMILMSKKTNRKLNSLLQAQQRFTDTLEVKGGFRVQSYNGIPIFRSIWISDAQTQGTASNCSDIFILDTNGVWIGELTPLKMLRLAQKSSQGSEFDILEDVTLVLANDIKASRLSGITL
ncbi:MAG TPA: phage major capsid protein [Elusimicrobiales bacterium]|nr:phage major capsid protein [Elusimicrobiales bacterium]